MKKTHSLNHLGFCLFLALLGQAAFSLSMRWPLMELIGLACFVFSGWILTRLETAASTPWQPERWMEISILIAIFLIGLVLRLYRLDTLPDGAFRDEGQSGIVAAHMLAGSDIYDTGTNTPLYLILVPAGFFYPMAVFFKWLGVSLYSVRLDSLVFGMLSLVAFYFLARRIMGVTMGLLLAFCLATLRWHINFSRVGFLGIMTFFIQIPFAYFLILGFQKPETASMKRLASPLLGIAWILALSRIFLSRVGGDFLGSAQCLVALLLQLPAWWCIAVAAKDARSRILMFAAAILGLSFYTYAAAYLLVFLTLGWCLYVVFRHSGALKNGKGKPLYWLAALFFLGVLVCAEGNALDWPWTMDLGLPLIMVSLIGVLTFLWRHRNIFQDWLKPLTLASLCFLIFAGPMLDYYFSHRERVDSRPNRISIFQHDIPNRDPSWGHALELNLVKTMGMVNVQGDGNPRHNIPNWTMLNPAWAAAFALGVALCLWQAFEPLPFLLLLWWQTVMLGGYFSIEAPQAYRTMDVIVPILLIMGLALQRLWRQLRNHVDPWLAGPIVIFLFFGLGAFYEVYAFFGKQTVIAEHWSAFSGDESQMGRDFKASPAGTHALLRPDWVNSYAFQFMAYPLTDFDAFDPSQDIPLKRMDAYGGKNVLYVLDQSYLPLKEVLQSYYPAGQYHEMRHPSTGEFLYWTYLVPASETQKVTGNKNGLTGHYYADLGETWKTDWKAAHWQKANLRLTRLDPFVLFHWTVAPVSERFYSVQWDGKLKITKSGAYDLSTSSDDYTEIEVDGHKVAESPMQPFAGGWVDGQVKLAQGMHKIRVRYYASKNTARVELWWQVPGQSEKKLIPMDDLFPE